ncbi:MAG TPA: tetratricopeptide repeat protein, partial [Polyangiales bacterium]|nr:tetratricopeptide repeat protein [Polyangiales bacterium]
MLVLFAPLRASAQSSEAATPSTSEDASKQAAGTGDDSSHSAAVSDRPNSWAVQHYERGREHYLAGRYREALAELKTALALDPKSPNLLYNVARVNEDLGNLDDAISYYQQYLEVLPDSDRAEREKTEKTVRRLQGAKEEVSAQRGSTGLMSFGPAPAAPPPPRFGRADHWFWLAAIGGGVLTLAGAGTGLYALKRERDTAHFVVGPDGTLDKRDKLATQANRAAMA